MWILRSEKKTENIWAHELCVSRPKQLDPPYSVVWNKMKSGHFDEKFQMPLAFINYYWVHSLNFSWCALCNFVHHPRSCHIYAYTSQVSLETTLLSIRPHTQFCFFVCCSISVYFPAKVLCKWVCIFGSLGPKNIFGTLDSCTQIYWSCCVEQW